MTYSINTHTIVAGEDEYDLSFAGASPGYIEEEHVKYFIGSVEQPDADRTFLTTTRVKIDPIPLDGVEISFRRKTSPDTALVDWLSGKPVTEVLLDKVNTQYLYLYQESADAGEIDTTDAYNSSVLAEKWAEEIEDTEVISGKYSALHHAAKAGDSEINASASEVAAGISATEARIGFSTNRYNEILATASDQIIIDFTFDVLDKNVDVYVSGIKQGYDTFTVPNNYTIQLSEVLPAGTYVEVLSTVPAHSTSSDIKVTQYLSEEGTNLPKVLLAIGSDNVTLVFDRKPADLNANLTIPSNVSLDWQRGCVLDGAYILTIAGTLEAGNYQLFGSDLTITYSESTTVYANWYSGESLAHQINNALSDAVRLVVRVYPQSTNYTWTTLVELTATDELHFDFIEQGITFEGSSGGSGASDIAIRLDRKSKLYGGAFSSSRSAWDLANPWTCVRGGASADEDGGKNITRDVKIIGFERGFEIITGSVRGHFYSKFNFREFVNCYYSIYLEGTDLDINSNTFDIRHISVDSIYSAAGDGNEIGIYLKENGGAIGHNTFNTPIIEHSGAGAARIAVKLEGAIYNSFYGIRHEGWYTDFVTVDGANDSPVHNYVYGSDFSPRVSLISQISLQFIGTVFPAVGLTGDYRSRAASNYVAYYPKIMTATTVTIGAAGNFDTLERAIEDYSGCILEANLTFQLLEDISTLSAIIISNFISAGGVLKIDLNGFTISSSASIVLYFIDCTGLSAKVFGNGTITSSKDGVVTSLILAQRMGYLDVDDINLGYTGDNVSYGINFVGTNARIGNLDTDATNPVDYTYQATNGSHLGEDDPIEAGSAGTRALSEGSMAIGNTGIIYTEAGSVTPT